MSFIFVYNCVSHSASSRKQQEREREKKTWRKKKVILGVWVDQDIFVSLYIQIKQIRGEKNQKSDPSKTLLSILYYR